jgi:hypothetical protein
MPVTIAVTNHEENGDTLRRHSLREALGDDHYNDSDLVDCLLRQHQGYKS